MLKLAILQRILPEFRYDLFEILSKEKNLILCVFFGKGTPTGASRNTERDYSTFAKRIPSFIYIKSKIRVIQPTLIFHLIKFNPSVIITEPATHFPNNFMGFIYAKIFRKKFVWWEIGMGKVDQHPLRNMIEPFIRIMIKYSNSYLAYSTQGKDYLVKNYNVSPEKIFIAYNTIYNQPEINCKEESNTRNQLGIKKGEKVITYIGALEKRKKLEIVFDSFGEIRKNGPVHLIIIGDGVDSEYYKNYAGKLDNIYFLGRKSISEANRYLFISDYTVLPSEGGLAINHSLSCGTPVICGTNDGTEKELIKEKLTGHILYNINSKKLTRTILSKNIFRRDEIRQFYFSNYSVNNMIVQIKKASGNL